jgi:hypothetical protein
MLIEINNDFNIDWTAKGINRIAQNVFNLLTTWKYEVAYDRTLGIDGTFRDKPFQEAISQATAQIYDIVAEREPRAIVKNVEYKSVDDAGNLEFRVVIDV